MEMMEIEKYQISLQDAITVSYLNCHARIPPILLGDPGIGKSWILQYNLAPMLARDLGRKLVFWEDLSIEERRSILDDPAEYFVVFDIRLSMYSFDEVKGVVYPRKLNNEDVMGILTPSYVRLALKRDSAGLVIYDEITSAPPSTQVTVFRYLYKREHEEGRFSDEFFFVGAGNLGTSRTVFYNLVAPLVNRIALYYIRSPTADEWIENFAYKWQGNPEPLDLQIKVRNIPKSIHPLVIGYLSNPANKTKIFLFNPEQWDMTPYPSPRSWHNTSKILHVYESAGFSFTNDEDLDILEMTLRGILGFNIATEFVGWVKLHKQLPDIPSVLRNPSSFSIPDRTDIIYLFMAGMTAYWSRDLSEKDRVNLLKNLLEIVLNMPSPEYSIAFLKMLNTSDPKFIDRYVSLRSSLPDWIKKKMGSYAKYLLKYGLSST